MLTIGELAQYAGVSIRTVRHYHQIGLLPEPPRDELGHRRYDAESLILLRRICTLAEAGVPLRLAGELLDADPSDRDEMLAEVDRDLRRHIVDLRRTRERLALVRTGQDAELPDRLPELLDRLRSMGQSEEQVHLDQETWRLSHLLYPDLTRQWLSQQIALLDDDDYRAIYAEALEVMELEPDDPRLEEVAARNVAWTLAHLEQFTNYLGEWEQDPRAARLVETFVRHRYDSPAHRRFRNLVDQGLKEAWPSDPTSPTSAGRKAPEDAGDLATCTIQSQICPPGPTFSGPSRSGRATRPGAGDC